MKINVSAGHAPDGGLGCGAVSLIKESTEARKVTSKVIQYLKGQGHTVYDCTCTENAPAATVLKKIVKKCNENKVDLDVSIHFNSGRKDHKGDGADGGTEVLIFTAGGASEKYAKNIAAAIAELGFRNRGVKLRPDLYFLRSTNAQAVLIEACFVDDLDDIKLYDADKMARAIVKGITGKAPTVAKTETVAEKTHEPGEFLVKVLVNELNIRTGPGTEYDVVGKIKDKGVYTIVKTSDDGKWGRLKSGSGFINISSTYCKRLG